MNGNSTPDQTSGYSNVGNYGIQGLASVNNCPPGLYQAVQWKDKEGNFWIYGGSGSDSMGGIISPADLWKYNPLNNLWTWVKGPGISGNPQQIFEIPGILGIPSPNNSPGTRVLGCSAWTDDAGDLWLFGGNGWDSLQEHGYFNDLWRYNIASNEWTRMAGSSSTNSPGIYGNLYQSSDSAIPPIRQEVNTAWTDANNNLWLFGGQYNSSESYSDLWKYNISIGQWAWMGGSEQFSLPANYGILGVESPANFPGGRCSYTHWIDSNYLYLSGGAQFGYPYLYNDVWRFNLNTNNWTWIGGDTGNVALGQYLHFCTTNYADEPRGRFEQRSTQINGCKPALFMWGGALDAQGDSVLNDLWNFDLVTGKWEWLSGLDSISYPGNYGIKGVSSPDNMPAGAAGACFWNDNDGNLWQWGGWSDARVGGRELPVFLNAMWKYIPDSTCLAINAVSVSSNGDTLVGYGGISYQWFLNGDTIIGATSPVYIARSAGTYTVDIASLGGCKLNLYALTITGIPIQLPDNHIKIFPNPSTTNWQIVVGPEWLGSEGEVYDALGRLIFKVTINNLQTTINLESIASAVYELRITQSGYTISKKLVKLQE